MTHRIPEDFLRPDDRSPLEGIDESFVFTYDTYADELGKGQRWSRWQDLEALMKGPEPRPDWVVTSSGAIDTELGVLKTGKEADVFLLEREDPHRPDGAVVMAAKRYRDTDHRTFHRAASYTEGRSMKRSRDNRALKRKSTWGKQVAAGEWAVVGVERALPLLGPRPARPLPGADRRDRDPDGVDHRDRRRRDRDRPRVAQTRPRRTLVAGYFDQLRDALATLVQAGLVHGDLSPYNTLAAGDRLVIIDLPQMVDLVGNPRGMDFLMRDCANMCAWFRSRGLEVDEQELFGELMAHAF